MEVENGGGGTLASQSGTGDMASMTWAPAAGSVDDGAYRWTVEATDGWGNGPLEAHGDVDVDTHAPDVSVVRRCVGDPDVHAQRRRLARHRRVHRRLRASRARSSRPSATRTATRSTAFSAAVGGSNASLAWDGKVGSGFVADGRYEIAFAARDRAGNTGDAVTIRTVDAYGALGFVATSKSTFFPQDGDANGRARSRSSFRLDDPATVSWTIVDADGDVVRTLKTDEALAAGSYSRSWDGRNDAGHIVPRGTYRSVVHASDGDAGREPVRLGARRRVQGRR